MNWARETFHGEPSTMGNGNAGHSRSESVCREWLMHRQKTWIEPIILSNGLCLSLTNDFALLSNFERQSNQRQ
jgi:hypothetical protein